MAFAATEEVPYDSSGRILMPPMMRRKGQIGDLALFLGTGETFQIWNPQLLLDDQRIPEDLKDIARFRLEERGLRHDQHRPQPGPTCAGAGRRGDRRARARTSGDTAVDGTFGAGGYTRAMLGAGAGRVIGFDRDPDAIEAGRSLVPDPRLTLINERFSQMDRVLAERGIGPVDAIALDIGVSSMQLDRAERGFSFSGRRSARHAHEQVGPDRRRIPQRGRRGRDRPRPQATMARSRAPARSPAPSSPPARSSGPPSWPRSSAAPPASARARRADPATRTFQAIRIHLNAELDELEQGLAAAERALKPGGRLAVVTFHSLEDRIVKRFFRERSGGDAGRFAPPSRASSTRANRRSSGSPSRFPRRSASWPRTRARARRACGARSAPSAPPWKGSLQ